MARSSLPLYRRCAVNGKYEIERRLGGGGMAEVFLAHTVGVEGFRRPVAIKRVLDGFSNDPRFARMFISEAQLTSRLRHPNIVSVVDFDRDAEGRLFLVLELVEGTDLDGLIATGPLPFALVIFLVIEILRGLDYAHELPIHPTDGVSAVPHRDMRGLVHRDMSPHNVLLSWEGMVKISDFGIAKARAATNASATAGIIGKPAYMSPEQARGEPLDGRSDLFAVGVMLFEMLCLQPLFAGATPHEAIAQVLNARIPNVRELRSEIPKDLSRVVAALLVRDRNERVPTASAAIEMLVACEDHPKRGREELVATLSQRFSGRAPIRPRDIQHLAHSAPTLVSSPPASTGRNTRTATLPVDVWPVRKARKRLAWALAVSLVVIAGAVGVIVASGRSTQSTVKPTSDEIRSTADSESRIPSSATSTAAKPSTAPIEPALATSRSSSLPATAGSNAAPAMLPSVEPTRDGTDRPVGGPSGVPSTGALRDRGSTESTQSRPNPRTTPKPDGIREIQLRTAQ
jgi:eukaryotic-like serine/threonine-protein kinase